MVVQTAVVVVATVTVVSGTKAGAGATTGLTGIGTSRRAKSC